jgi:hypothetical protein
MECGKMEFVFNIRREEVFIEEELKNGFEAVP